jgi:uncharacterized protein YjbJ (UPF0337 family)
MTINQQMLEGHWNEIKGKLRERWGKLTNDDLDRVHGSAEQLVGTIQRKTGEGQEAIEQFLEELTNDGASLVGNVAETVRQYSASAKDSVESAATSAQDAVKAGYDQAETAIHARPMESLAVSFGTGLIAGLILGLLVRSK